MQPTDTQAYWNNWVHKQLRFESITNNKLDRKSIHEAAGKIIEEKCGDQHSLYDALDALCDAGFIHKPLDREDAFKKLDGYYNHHHINVILDLIGY